MAQSVGAVYQNSASPEPLQQGRKTLEMENIRAARTNQSLSDLSGAQAMQKLPKESLAKMTFYRPDTGSSSLPRSMAYPASGAAVANTPVSVRPAAPAAAGAQPANTVYGADGSRKEASMLPEMARQNGTEAYTGCKTCQSRTYQDGSDDAGVSFQTAKHIPASTAGIAVVSHEGEHVSRETDKAAREDRVVTQKKVTTQMGCCPECHKIYVAGGTTTIATMAAKSDSADAQSALETLGGAGEQLDFEV